MIVVGSLCARVGGAFGNDSFAHLHNPDRLADLVVLGLVQRGESSVLALAPQVAQQLLVLDFVFEAQLLAHGFVFGEEELLSRDVLVSLFEAELESSEVEDSFCALLFESLQLGLTLFCSL